MLTSFGLILHASADPELLPAVPLLSQLWGIVDEVAYAVSIFTSAGSDLATSSAQSDFDRQVGDTWPRNFEYALAADFFLFSEAVYCSKSGLGHLQCGGLCDSLATHVKSTANLAIIASPHTESQVLVAKDFVNDVIVITPRGSTPWDLSYFLVDVGAFPQRIPEYCDTCYVHSAFYAAVAPMKEEVYSLAARWQSETSHPIMVGGHSAGGATANLMAFDLAHGLALPPGYDAVAVRYLMTYGSPRVGNRAFVLKLQEKAGTQHGISEGWRVIKTGDPVPYTVPAFMGYIHALPEVQILPTEGMFKVCKPLDESALFLSEDPTCTEQTLLWFGADISQHTQYFGDSGSSASSLLACGLINEENAFFNSTVEFAITEGFGRSVRSWLPS